MDNVAFAFIIVAAVAIVVQMGVLVALYASTRKTGERVQALAAQMEEHGIPALKMARELLEENGPRIKEMVVNANATVSNLREQVQRIDVTVSDVVDRTRLQVIRADELVTRTIDRVEETTEFVHHTVISPVRAVAGLLQGITAGAGSLFGRFRRRRGRNGQGEEDEMFI
jgi:hypothetical protein